jgi:hypothetical protein
VLLQNDDEDKMKKVLTAIVQVEDELEVVPELEMHVPHAVQVAAKVAVVVAAVSLVGLAPPPCGGAADYRR